MYRSEDNSDRTPDSPDNRKLYLGCTLAAFMQQLGIHSDSGGSGGNQTRLKKQIDRLFKCSTWTWESMKITR